MKDDWVGEDTINETSCSSSPLPGDPACEKPRVRELVVMDGTNWKYDYQQDRAWIDGRAFVPEVVPRMVRNCARCQKLRETIHIPTKDGKGEGLCGQCIAAMLAEAHDLMDQARTSLISCERSEHPTLAAFRRVDPESAQAYADCGPQTQAPYVCDECMKLGKNWYANCPHAKT
jgi:hypothetical protein